MSRYQPPNPLLTPDMVVAQNLRRLRDERGLTRPVLAAQLTRISGTEWSRWKLVDLEGARSQTQEPRPATWADLVAIAVALRVSIYELVLPTNPEARVVVAVATKTEESAFPYDESIPEDLRGKPKRLSRSYVHKSDRDELGQLLFGLPGNSLTPENLERIAEQFGRDMTDALADIAGVQEGLARAIELIESLQKQQQEKPDGIDS